MADKEKYYIPIGGTRIEVEKAVYEAYYKMSRRERYMEERDESNGVVSYHAMEANGIDGEAGLRDMSTDSLETVAMAKELHEQLHRCIAALPKAERELIHAIYFDGMTETKYSQKVKLSQSGISRRRKKTLSKLKVYGRKQEDLLLASIYDVFDLEQISYLLLPLSITVTVKVRLGRS